jgi:nucleotide-binding universal stress UspA family protein
MYARVLLTLDGTPLAEQALVYAVSIARRAGASLHIATVKQFPSSLLPELPVQASVGEVEVDYLDEVATRVRDAGVSDVSVRVLEGLDVAATLLAHRKEVDAGLTVMSTHGRGPVRRAWMGSVADRYVRASRAPVFVVRAVEDQEPEKDLSVDVSFSRVLVPLDGSAESEAALEPATQLGRLSDAAYVLLRLSLAPHALGSPWLPAAVEATEEEIESARVEAESELEGAAGQLRGMGFEVEVISSFVEHIAQGILEWVEDTGADVIVMATHGRGGVRRLALGSVTDKVVRAAACPVLVVPPAIE